MTQSHFTPLSRCADGRRWWIKDTENYQSHSYDITIEPKLREIRAADGSVAGFVTRNRYNAQVLNTNQMLIIDIDIQDNQGRCPSARLYDAVLTHARHGERIDFEELIRFQLAGGRQVWEAEPDTVDERSWRLYQTRNGYRLLETSDPWILEPWPEPLPLFPSAAADKALDKQLDVLMAPDEALIELMERLYADSAYIKICLDQRLFRARLTEKPWRAKTVNGPTRTCSFLGTVGTGIIHPDLELLLREHDHVTGAHDLAGTLA